jgi:hypothetical protein
MASSQGSSSDSSLSHQGRSPGSDDVERQVAFVPLKIPQTSLMHRLPHRMSLVNHMLFRSFTDPQNSS